MQWADIGLKDEAVKQPPKSGGDPEATGSLEPPQIAVDAIETEWQPRGSFEHKELSELAESIKESGILQPITLTRHSTVPGRFVVQMGERRFRAAQLAQLKTVPAYVRPVATDFKKVAEQLVENILREKLFPLEIALGLKAMQEKKEGVSVRGLARAIGKDAKYVSAHLKLLEGPPEVTELLEERICTDVDCADHLRKIFELDSDAGYRFVKQYRSDNPPSRQELRESYRSLKRNDIAESKNPFKPSKADLSRKVTRPPEKASIRVKYTRGEFSGEGRVVLDAVDEKAKFAWVVTDDNEELRVPLKNLKVVSIT